MIVVDIETPQWFDMPQIKHLLREVQLAEFEVGVAVTAVPDMHGPSFADFNGDKIVALADTLVANQPIVGWNILDFDLIVIQNHHKRATGAIHPGLRDAIKVDLFHEIRTQTGRWYKLDEVAQATLGRGKSADGLQAAQWLRDGQYYRAANYCRDDVELETALLYAAMNRSLHLPAYNKRGVRGHAMRWGLTGMTWGKIPA